MPCPPFRESSHQSNRRLSLSAHNTWAPSQWVPPENHVSSNRWACNQNLHPGEIVTIITAEASPTEFWRLYSDSLIVNKTNHQFLFFSSHKLKSSMFRIFHVKTYVFSKTGINAKMYICWLVTQTERFLIPLRKQSIKDFYMEKAKNINVMPMNYVNW